LTILTTRFYQNAGPWFILPEKNNNFLQVYDTEKKYVSGKKIFICWMFKLLISKMLFNVGLLKTLMSQYVQ